MLHRPAADGTQLSQRPTHPSVPDRSGRGIDGRHHLLDLTEPSQQLGQALGGHTAAQRQHRVRDPEPVETFQQLGTHIGRDPVRIRDEGIRRVQRRRVSGQQAQRIHQTVRENDPAQQRHHGHHRHPGQLLQAPGPVMSDRDRAFRPRPGQIGLVEHHDGRPARAGQLGQQRLILGFEHLGDHEHRDIAGIGDLQPGTGQCRGHRAHTHPASPTHGDGQRSRQPRTDLRHPRIAVAGGKACELVCENLRGPPCVVAGAPRCLTKS